MIFTMLLVGTIFTLDILLAEFQRDQADNLQIWYYDLRYAIENQFDLQDFVADPLK